MFLLGGLHTYQNENNEYPVAVGRGGLTQNTKQSFACLVHPLLVFKRMVAGEQTQVVDTKTGLLIIILGTAEDPFLCPVLPGLPVDILLLFPRHRDPPDQFIGFEDLYEKITGMIAGSSWASSISTRASAHNPSPVV